jgi:hypothetical protein
MKLIYPLSRDYLSKEESQTKTAQQAAPQVVQPTASVSKYTADDGNKVDQARNLLLQITARVSAGGGIGVHENEQASHDLEITKLLQAVIFQLGKIQEVL